MWVGNVGFSTPSRNQFNTVSRPGEWTEASARESLGSEWLGLKVWEEGDVAQALLNT